MGGRDRTYNKKKKRKFNLSHTYEFIKFPHYEFKLFLTKKGLPKYSYYKTLRLLSILGLAYYNRRHAWIEKETYEILKKHWDKLFEKRKREFRKLLKK